MTPNVYEIPPSKSSIIPSGGTASIIGLNENTINQPIIIYKTNETLCHFFKSIELNTMPSIDSTPIIPNITQPRALLNSDRQIGI